MDGRLIFLWALLVVYIPVYHLKVYHPEPGFVNSYMGDLLAMPVILLLLDVIMRKLYNGFDMNLQLVIITTVIVAVTFEAMLPFLSDKYVSDWKDVCCYCAGSSVFFLVYCKRRHKKGSPQKQRSLR